MRSALCVALTPALSQRERGQYVRARWLNSFGESEPLDSLSLWERVGVRAAAYANPNLLTGAHP
jgi:hypothetical protein